MHFQLVTTWLPAASWITDINLTAVAVWSIQVFQGNLIHKMNHSLSQIPCCSVKVIFCWAVSPLAGSAPVPEYCMPSCTWCWPPQVWPSGLWVQAFLSAARRAALGATAAAEASCYGSALQESRSTGLVYEEGARQA